jgi:hypothetical protein
VIFLFMSSLCLDPLDTQPFSLDDPVRPHQHVRRNDESELLSRLQIDYKLELHRLLYRKIGGLGAF